MKMLTVKTNGNEMAWVNENYFGDADMMYSIETFRWEDDDSLQVRTYYDMPEKVGVEDDPYEYLLQDKQ